MLVDGSIIGFLQDLNEDKEKGIKLKTYDSQNMIPSLKLVKSKAESCPL